MRSGFVSDILHQTESLYPSPCWPHRGQSSSVSLPRPNMLTRLQTPALWDLLQTVLGTNPMFGCIHTVYGCLGLQVAERRQMLDLCFPLVKYVSGEPFISPTWPYLQVSTAAHIHIFSLCWFFFPSPTIFFLHIDKYTHVFWCQVCGQEQTWVT